MRSWFEKRSLAFFSGPDSYSMSVVPYWPNFRRFSIGVANRDVGTRIAFAEHDLPACAGAGLVGVGCAAQPVVTRLREAGSLVERLCFLRRLVGDAGSIAAIILPIAAAPLFNGFRLRDIDQTYGD
jgi:hypothetical protein